MAEDLVQPHISEGIALLQLARHELATQRSNIEFYTALSNSLSDQNLTLANTKADGRWNDINTLLPRDLLAFDAIGINNQLRPVLTDPTRVGENLATVQAGNKTVQVQQYGTGITFKIEASNQTGYDTSEANPLKHAITERLLRSPGHRELSRICNDLSASPEGYPDRVTTQPFDPMEDPLGSIVLLQEIGLIGFSSGKELARRLLAGEASRDAFSSAILAIPDSTATRNDTRDTIDYTWGKEITHSLSIDRRTGKITLAVAQQPNAYYPERANQSTAEARPFIETACANELGTILDQAGLMFHPDLQAAMVSVEESDRYGSIYTQITRELAKWVNDPGRTRLSNLFVPKNRELTGLPLAHKLATNSQYGTPSRHIPREPQDTEADVRGQWEAVTHNAESEAARVIISLIDQTLQRPQEGTHQTDLPVTQSEVHLRDGACFDAINYYLGGAAQKYMSNGTRHFEANGVHMLEKRYGSHTFLTTEPIIFNGIQLPRGALFSRTNDGWALLRLTAFTFDDPQDQIAAAGSELVKAYLQQRETIHDIGGLTLDGLKLSAF